MDPGLSRVCSARIPDRIPEPGIGIGTTQKGDIANKLTVLRASSRLILRICPRRPVGQTVTHQPTWKSLPEAVHAGIVAMVRAAGSGR
jgi:hypothetical protein